jgi:antitoxin component of MazEF toxin-antitoxin module
MNALSVGAAGELMLQPKLLQHLGIHFGDKVEVDLLPNHELRLKAARPTGSIDGFIGLLAGKSPKTLTLEEMNEIAASGWAGQE